MDWVINGTYKCITNWVICNYIMVVRRDDEFKAMWRFMAHSDACGSGGWFGGGTMVFWCGGCDDGVGV